MAELFPASTYPAETRAKCFRCDVTYDPGYPSQCRMPHPTSVVDLMDKDMRGSEYYCGRCGCSWHMSSTPSYEGWVDEESECCFQGPHQPLQQVSADEKWERNDSG